MSSVSEFKLHQTRTVQDQYARYYTRSFDFVTTTSYNESTEVLNALLRPVYSGTEVGTE